MCIPFQATVNYGDCLKDADKQDANLDREARRRRGCKWG